MLTHLIPITEAMVAFPVVLAASIIAALGSVVDTSQPETMIKIVVRISGPGIKPGSHAALPRTMYEAGPHYARLEDPPDVRQGIEKVTIIAEPDAYSVNLIDRRGTHVIDQGGPGDRHLPIVLPFDPKRKFPVLDRLEFGHEVAGFEQAGAEKQAGPLINGQPTVKYVLKTESGDAALIVKSGTNIPVFLSWPSTNGIYRYEYSMYQEMPFDSKLFSKPEGVRLKEVPPDTSFDQ